MIAGRAHQQLLYCRTASPDVGWAGCGDVTGRAGVRPMMNTNETLAHKFYDTFNKRNLEGVAQIVDEKCTITNMATGETYKGVDGGRKWKVS